MLKGFSKIFSISRPEEIIRNDLKSFESIIPLDDESDVETFQSGSTNENNLGHAEAQTFGIEYVNAAGVESRRLITVFDIKMPNDMPLLQARCHNSKRTKCFRIDRIETIFDVDGEVFAVESFLIENFGMHSELAALSRGLSDKQKGHHDECIKTWNDIRDSIKNQALLLSALALADNKMCESEIDQAIRYFNLCCSKRGHILTDNVIEKLRRYFKRMRPSEARILNALDDIAELAPDQKNDFIVACAKMIAADRVITPEENAMLEEFSEALTGIALKAEISALRTNNPSNVFGSNIEVLQ